ncbi:Nuclear receptor sub 2 group C member 2 [Branchiostoma belcheri]|nr:Nuclear receptor sub 2 group C member 2 [Branchiostoma belcheri]
MELKESKPYTITGKLCTFEFRGAGDETWAATALGETTGAATYPYPLPLPRADVTKSNMFIVGGKIGQTWMPWTMEQCEVDLLKQEEYMNSLSSGTKGGGPRSKVSDSYSRSAYQLSHVPTVTHLSTPSYVPTAADLFPFNKHFRRPPYPLARSLRPRNPFARPRLWMSFQAVDEFSVKVSFNEELFDLLGPGETPPKLTTLYEDVPLFFALMSRRKKQDYTAVLTHLDARLPTHNVAECEVDFKEGMWRALPIKDLLQREGQLHTTSGRHGRICRDVSSKRGGRLKKARRQPGQTVLKLSILPTVSDLRSIDQVDRLMSSYKQLKFDYLNRKYEASHKIMERSLAAVNAKFSRLQYQLHCKTLSSSYDPTKKGMWVRHIWKLQEFINKMAALTVDPTEYAYMKALVLFSTDHPGLLNPRQIEKFQESGPLLVYEYQGCLFHGCCNHTDVNPVNQANLGTVCRNKTLDCGSSQSNGVLREPAPPLNPVNTELLPAEFTRRPDFTTVIARSTLIAYLSPPCPPSPDAQVSPIEPSPTPSLRLKKPRKVYTLTPSPTPTDPQILKYLAQTPITQAARRYYKSKKDDRVRAQKGKFAAQCRPKKREAYIESTVRAVLRCFDRIDAPRINIDEVSDHDVKWALAL